MTLKQKYEKEVRPSLLKEFGYTNIHQAPKLVKVVLNVGIGKETTDAKAIEKIANNLKDISGQAPSIRNARKAIAGFKIREGQPVGLMVTLRGEKMYSFLEKVTKVVFPRVRDFRGLSKASFDTQGNYTLGFPEIMVFPEVDMNTVDKGKGLQATIVTTAKIQVEAEKLLTELGFKFKEEKGKTN